MPLLSVLVGILLLFFLIAYVKLNGFLAFIIVCLQVGLSQGMAIGELVGAIQAGIGNTLGGLVLILGLGAMLGKLVADSGAAQRITSQLIAAFGRNRIQLAVVLAGFIIGIPMFYTVGFVILIPLIFTIAATTGLNLVYVGLPMLAALSVTHGYLPPHPAPTGIAIQFGADIGKTLLLGIVVAIPAILVAGPILTRFLKQVEARPKAEFVNPIILTDAEMPSTAISILSALLPVILIGLGALLTLVLPEGGTSAALIEAIGNPVLAMLYSVLFAVLALGIWQGRTMEQAMTSVTSGVTGITTVLLIIAGAGALTQVLKASGVSDYIGSLLEGTSVSPLVLAWLIATLIRVSVGSATVAGFTAAGIVAPLAALPGVSPELLVLAIGSGSLMLSHVNDGGFWLFKEYFNVSIEDTLRTWTVMETTVGVMGLLGVLLLDLVI